MDFSEVKSLAAFSLRAGLMDEESLSNILDLARRAGRLEALEQQIERSNERINELAKWVGA